MLLAVLARLRQPAWHPQGTDAGAKNELLHSRFGVNYNNLPEQFKKVGRACQVAGSSCALRLLRGARRCCLSVASPALAQPCTGLLQGSVVIRQQQQVDVGKQREDGTPVLRTRRVPVVLHCDIIRDEPFWASNPELLA